MTMMQAFKGLVGFVGCAVVATSLHAADAPKAVVDYRESVMKAMGSSMGALGAIARGEVSFQAHAALHATNLLGLSKLVPELFPEGTGPDHVKTAAKAEVWQKPEEFKAAAQKFEEESSKLLAAAQGSDPEAFKAQFTELRKVCSACHDGFRVREEH